MTRGRVEAVGCADLVEVPAGSFWMGWDAGAPGERPRHRVWLGDFAIGRYPVTNEEYAAFLAAAGAAPPPWWTDARFSGPRQPVVGVSWFDAGHYCAWRSERDGRGYRLPTEAEWEKAARGGLEDLRYPWGDDRPGPDRFSRPPLVTDGPANPLGLRALSGVCHEWCLDWDSDDSYAVAPERNPRGPASGTRRLSRGGAWRHQDPWSPVAHRSSLPPRLRYSDYGFRLVTEPREVRSDP